MAHGTRINGTAYGVTGGKCLVGGTEYAIKKGRTLVNGTGHDVKFTPTLTLHIKITAHVISAVEEEVRVVIDEGYPQIINVLLFELGSARTFTYEYNSSIEVSFFARRRNNTIVSEGTPTYTKCDVITVDVNSGNTSIIPEGYET